MNERIAGRIWAAACFLATACGSSGESGPRDAPVVDWSQVNPPDNIDIASCVAIRSEVSPTDRQTSERCLSCCQSAGFSTSSFINDDQCTCGRSLDDGRDTVCNPQASSSQGCGQCCTAAGFMGHAFAGNDSSSECRCQTKRDASICAPATRSSEPGEACALCCLNNGFLGSGYSGLGTPECLCFGP